MAKGRYLTDVKPKLFLIENWAKDGLIDIEIAKRLGISEATFYDYKLKHPEFSEAIKKGKEVVDFEVEQALLKRALGYEYIETTKEYAYDNTLKATKETNKIVPPDITAQIFWLKNRKPKEWKDKHENTVDFNSGDVEINIKAIKEEK